MKKTIISLMAFLIIISVQAQTFGEFKKQQQASFQEFKKEAEAQMKALQQHNDAFMQQRDKEFADFLQQRWEEYNLFEGIKKEPLPKPVVVPMMELPEPDVLKEDIPPRLLPLKVPALKPTAVTDEALRLPPRRKTEAESFPVSSLSVNFYGNKIEFDYDKALLVSPPENINNFSISNFWSKASKTNYNHLLDQLESYRYQLNLNDWAYYLLIKETTAKLYPQSANAAVLMTWFVMTKAGYKARVAFSGNKAMLLLASEQTVYERNFQEFDGLKYYLVDASAERIQTYGKDFPGAKRPMDFNLSSPLNLRPEPETKKLSFELYNKQYHVEISYDKGLITFYNDYPNTQMDIYLSAANSVTFKESVNEVFLPLIAGKTERDAVSLMLQFTQSAFEYAFDHNQFGREKFMFAEELLFYPGSDCEDRSAMFAYLVRELLGLKVIGLQYPDHIATAVCFNENVSGDYYIFNNEKYVVCDPTYVNAPIGKTMPQYNAVTAQLLRLDNNQNEKIGREKLWQQVYAAGGQRASANGNIVTDASGKHYLAGFFKNRLNLGEKSLSAASGEPSAFVAAFSPDGRVLWTTQPAQPHSAMASYIALDDRQNLYVSGTFRNSISFGNHTLSAGDASDVFVVCFNSEGSVQWAKKASLDTIPGSMNYMFSLEYKPDGKQVRAYLLPELQGFTGFGLSISDSGNIMLMGASYSITGLSANEVSFASGDQFDIGRSLKEENDNLLKLGFDSGIAGLFAALNIIRINNVVISGKIVREVLDTYNPKFKTLSPSIYASLSRINFLKNEAGIIQITTNDTRPVNFDYMRINHGAAIKIAQFSGNTARIEVLSGISVGKSVVWYNLNIINLIGISGDLIFDYSRDNSKRKINLKKDVLF